MLAQDWDAFCRAFNKMWREPVHLDLKSELKNEARGSVVRVPIDHVFLAQELRTLLQSLGAHLKGFSTISIDDWVDPELSALVKAQAARRPWTDLSSYRPFLKRQCEVALELQTQKKYVEASSVWSDLLMDVGQHLPPQDQSQAQSDELDELIFTICFNNGLCYLHFLDSVPESFQISSYEELGERAWFMLGTSPQPENDERLRANCLLAQARVRRLSGRRISRFSTTRWISWAGELLETAKRLDPSNDGIQEEETRWAEWSDSVLQPNNEDDPVLP